MYTKDEFNKYYLAGKAIAEPIHVAIDLHSCGTTFYERCWYIDYDDYVRYNKALVFKV